MDKKMIKLLGQDRVNSISGKSPEQLKEVIVTASRQKEEAKRELESNESYRRAKEDMKALSGATKDLNKELNAVIKLAVQLLEEKGAV